MTLDEGKKKMALMATTLQTLIRETSTKATNTWKSNYQNRDKKGNGSTSKEVHTLKHASNTPLLAPHTLKH